jgi:ribose transport system substrate-binding protein
MRRLRSVLLLACVASLTLSSGCRNSHPAVAVIPRTTATLLWKPLHEGIVQASHSAGVSVDWNELTNGSDTEQQMYASLQNKGYRGFIFAPDETLAARTAVLDTVNRGTPVVIVDDELGPPPSSKLSYVTNDEAKGTLLAAQEVERLLHGKGNIAITGINPRSEISLSREESFEKAITAVAPSIQIVDRRFGDAVITHQQQIAQELMTGTTRVGAIIALSSTSTLGAYYARLATPPPETIHIVGFDQESLLPLETGGIDAMVAQDTRSIGENAMRNLSRQILGDSVPGVTLVSPLLLTRVSLQSPELQRRLDFLGADKSNGEEEASLWNQARQRALRAGVQPISVFLMQPGRHPNVTLQGAVISLPPLLAIQDDTNALIIPHFHSNVPLKLGDIVTAHGTVVSQRFRSSLEDADIRVLWSDLAAPPFAVTAAQLTGGTYRGRKISLEGTLVAAQKQELILRDGDLRFRGVSTPDHPLDASHFEVGSRLRVGGLATSLTEFTNGSYPFAVLIEDVHVVNSPPWWSPRHIVLLTLGCVLLLLAIQFGYHRAQQWHLESVMHEREELAFEMHDTLAQSFTGIAFQLRAAGMENRGEDRLRTHIGRALEMVDQSHKEASRTIAALRPQIRDAAAILLALEESANRLVDGGPLRVRTMLTGRPTRLPVQVIDVLFRVGQEAVSNAVQHSSCNELLVELVLRRSDVQLSIRDNGHGFDTAALHSGLGLPAMKRRAQKIRGKLEISSSTSTGTAIVVTVPLPSSARIFRPFLLPIRRSRRDLGN